MNLKEFVEKVQIMRELQKRYFKYKTGMDLTAARKAERDVDDALARQGPQAPPLPTLFSNH
jgi:hypothetical protein